MTKASSVPEALARKIAAFTVTATATPAPSFTEVIVVAHGAGLEQGFARARMHLAAGRSVRLVGSAVTLPRTWPTWTSSERSLVLTEIGAFFWTSQAVSTRTLQDEMRSWVRSVCGDAFSPLGSDKVLFTGACARFLQPYIGRFALESSLAQAFPGARVEHINQAGVLSAALPPLRRAEGFRWRAKVAAWGALGLGASLVEMTRAYASAAPSFREIANRRHGSKVQSPRTWVGLVPDWYRINHHLLEAFAMREADVDDALGILLVGSIHPGRRDEAHMKVWHPTESIWPGLGDLRARLDGCRIEQASMPDNPVAFARALALGTGRACRTLAGLVTSSPRPFNRFSVDLSHQTRAAATWATVDVIRATVAQVAAERLVRRVEFSGKDIIFVASNNVQIAPVDQLLQHNGARTIHHEHGAGGDFFSGAAGCESSVRCLWTAPDARSADDPRVRRLVTGMPIRFRIAPRTVEPRHVLLMSNYVHRDSMIGGKFPFEPMNNELLETIRLISERGHPQLEFRWRPHPADDDVAIRRSLAGTARVSLSRNEPLERDAAWADVIISSMSTAVVEVLFVGVPVFVHLDPVLWGLPASDFLDPSRVFFRAEDGATAVGRWLAAWDASKDTLAPEQRARTALFGPSGAPIPMTEYFGRHARLEVPAIDTYGARFPPSPE